MANTDEHLDGTNELQPGTLMMRIDDGVYPATWEGMIQAQTDVLGGLQIGYYRVHANCVTAHVLDEHGPLAEVRVNVGDMDPRTVDLLRAFEIAMISEVATGLVDEANDYSAREECIAKALKLTRMSDLVGEASR